MPLVDESTRINIIIGQNVRKHRKKRRWSQKRLGRVLDISFQQVGKYEKGINSLPATKLWQLSRKFECTVDSLFYSSDAEERKALEDIRAIRGLHQSAVQSLIRNLEVIASSPPLQEHLVNIVHCMADTYLKQKKAELV